MRESFAFNRLLNASVLAVEHQHFSARAALAANQAQSFAISKIMSTQWRKVDGRWP
jgi:hypothetical protein